MTKLEVKFFDLETYSEIASRIFSDYFMYRKTSEVKLSGILVGLDSHLDPFNGAVRMLVYEDGFTCVDMSVTTKVSEDGKSFEFIQV